MKPDPIGDILARAVASPASLQGLLQQVQQRQKANAAAMEPLNAKLQTVQTRMQAVKAEVQRRARAGVRVTWPSSDLDKQRLDLAHETADILKGAYEQALRENAECISIMLTTAQAWTAADAQRMQYVRQAAQAAFRETTEALNARTAALDEQTAALNARAAALDKREAELQKLDRNIRERF